MNIVALIPARGGSKGILRKNLVPLGGRPLIAHTIACALNVSSIQDVYVSTDDDEIAAVSETFGASAPFRRPSSSSGDNAPMVAVIQHFLDWVESAGRNPAAVVLLQPTSPLREPASVEAAIRLFCETGAESVVSIVDVAHNCAPGSLLRRSADGRVAAAFPEEGMALRRQDKPRLFARNGPAVLVIKPELAKSGRLYSGNTFGCVMNKRESFDIDDREDLEIAEALLRRAS